MEFLSLNISTIHRVINLQSCKPLVLGNLNLIVRAERGEQGAELRWSRAERWADIGENDGVGAERGAGIERERGLQK